MAKRILIADDSVTIQKAFAMTFAGADDLTVASARSADEALSMAQKLQPDLILADGVMPGRSGYDLCASVRGDPALRAIPVFILASTQQPYDEGRGQQVGATGHLSKPWDTTAILDRLRDTLNRGESGLAGAALPPAPPARTTAASLPATAIQDDEYGEISIDTGRDTAPESRARLATPPPPAPVPGRMTSPSMPGMSGGPAPGMRPSLIPGMRPGTMPPVRPGTAPVRPLAGPAPTAAPPRPAAAPVGRTLMGLPAANLGMMRPSPPAAPSIAHAPPGMAAPMRPPTAPVAPLQARGGTAPHAPTAHAPAPQMPVHAPAPYAPAAAAVSASVDQKLAAYAAKGPEYEAIAKLSREIIEQIVWEVVPDLAEAIIREQVAKRNI